MGRGERVRALWGWRTAVEEEEAQRRRTWRERLHSAARRCVLGCLCDVCCCVCVCRILQKFIGHHTQHSHSPYRRPERPRTTHAARSNNMPLCPAVPRACSRVSSPHTLRSSLASHAALRRRAAHRSLSLPARTAPCPLPHHQHPVPTHVSRSLSHQQKHTKSRGRSSRRNTTPHTKQKKTPHPKTKQRAGCGSVVTNLSQY